MNDAELIALAALANIEAVIMDGENQERALNNQVPAWRPGTGYLPAGTSLWTELKRRKII